jgi:hypothetical protein
MNQLKSRMIKPSYLLTSSLVLILSAFQPKPEIISKNQGGIMSNGSDFSLKWDNTTVDFGKTPINQPVIASFVLTNTGDKPFMVNRVNYSSSMIAYYRIDSVFPGQRSEIKVTYGATVAGSFRKQVNVIINDQFYHLELTGTVVVPPSWQKTEHDFGIVKQDSILETSFKLFNGSDTLQIENVQSSCGCLTPDWTRKSIMPNDSTEIKVVFDTFGKRDKNTKVIAVYTNLGLYELIIKAEIADD